MDNSNKKEIEITLKKFHYMEDEIPEDFEVCFLLLDDGTISAGCWDRGIMSLEIDPRGVFRQSRGGIVDPDFVVAWKTLENPEEVYDF